MLPIQSMLSGRNPYDIRLYDGAPISPGPGWLFLNIPFGFQLLHSLLTPAYFLACSHIWRTLIGENANLPIILCMFCPIFWSLTGSGSDLVALGFALLLCFLVVECYLNSGKSVAWIALLVGTIATSRIIFIGLPVLLGILFFKRNKAVSIRFACAGLAVSLVWHLLFWSISDFYPPLHLIGRGTGNVSANLMLVAGLLIIYCLFDFFRKQENDFYRRLQTYVCVLASALGAIALGELGAVRYDFGLWEGASYLFVAAPAVAFAVCAKGMGQK